MCGATGYPRRLARSLGRYDLKIVTPGWVEMGKYRASSFVVVLDHAVMAHMKYNSRFWRAMESVEHHNAMTLLRQEGKEL